MRVTAVRRFLPLPRRLWGNQVAELEGQRFCLAGWRVVGLSVERERVTLELEQRR